MKIYFKLTERSVVLSNAIFAVAGAGETGALVLLQIALHQASGMLLFWSVSVSKILPSQLFHFLLLCARALLFVAKSKTF